MTGNTKETYHLLKSKGICTHCGVNDARPGKVHCAMCAATINDFQRIRYHTRPEVRERVLEQSHSEKAKEARRKLYESRIEKGLCFRCGKYKPAGTSKWSQCALCNLKSSEKQKERRYQKNISSIPQFMRGNGVYCYHCAKPKCKGTKVCSDCLVILQAHMENVRKFVKQEDNNRNDTNEH